MYIYLFLTVVSSHVEYFIFLPDTYLHSIPGSTVAALRMTSWKFHARMWRNPKLTP